MHLAQLNVAIPRFDLDHPRMAGFMDNLDRINAIAERSPGFVWRLKGDGNDATDLRYGDDSDTIYNVSVWESAEALEHFVWNTAHAKIYNRKAEWFPDLGTPHFVMWSVPEGHEPAIAEAVSRLEMLRENGPSPEAFGWKGLPHLTRWLEKRCG